MSPAEVDGSERRQKKKLVIVSAILFLIQKLEKLFSGSLTNSAIEDKDKEKSKDEDEDLTDDADKAFLMSVLPDLKNLNDDEKLEFRLHTLQFFKNIRNGSKQQMQQMPSYSGIQSPNQHPLLSQYFLNYQSQQSSAYSGMRDYMAPPNVTPSYPYFPPREINQLRYREPIFRDELLNNSKQLDDYLLDLK